MAIRPHESLKEVAAKLSELILSGKGSTEERMSLLSLLPGRATSVEENSSHDRNSGSSGEEIGIWIKVSANGKTVFRRDSRKLMEWLLWADTAEIKPKKDKKRILLLGESVARGYFFDPHYTVAKELEMILNISSIGSAGFEVIDLARTAINIQELIQLIRSCKFMEPDLVVIFAGNNWANKYSRDEDERLYKVFEKKSFDGIKSDLDSQMIKKVKGFFSEIDNNFSANSIPVVFVIPEFNLKDWKSDETEKSLSWLPGNRRQEWLVSKDVAEKAILKNDKNAWEQAANEMIKLDALNPYSHEMLGHFNISCEKWEEARANFENARDTSLLGNSTMSSPRCFNIIKKTIITEARLSKVHVIDLSEVFKNEISDNLPDRLLFLDYCHLTVKGIKIAMRATAHTIFRVISGQNPQDEDIKESNFEPPAEVQAIAHFSAAIHNAHYAQSAEIIKYHCAKSVSINPSVKNLMIEYLDFSTRNISTTLCRSFQDIIAGEEMRQYDGGFGLRHPRHKKLLDIDLGDAIVESLSAIDACPAGYLNELRIKEHGISSEWTDLLQSFYGENTYNRFADVPQPQFAPSRTREQTFYFIAKNDHPILFQLVYRTLGIDKHNNPVEIFVNQGAKPVARCQMSTKWITCSFQIEKELLINGPNKLIVVWPFTNEQFFHESLYSNRTFLKAAFPALGEIFSLSAASAKM